MPYFSQRCKSNSIYKCAVKLYDILRVKNVLVMSVYIIRNLVKKIKSNSVMA